MKRITILAGLAAVLFSLTGETRADTIKLKNGSTEEGIITSENGTEIKIEVEKAGGTIRVTHSYPTAEIESITRSTAQEKAEVLARREYLSLAKYKLDPDRSYPGDFYERIIRDVFQPFVTRYGTTTLGAPVRQSITEWQAELDQVNNGLAKLHGKWLPAAEATARATQEQCDKLMTDAKKFIDQGKWPEAAQRLELLMATNVPATVTSDAKTLLTDAYQKWYDALDDEDAALDDQIKNAKVTVEQLQTEVAGASGKPGGRAVAPSSFGGSRPLGGSSGGLHRRKGRRGAVEVCPVPYANGPILQPADSLDLPTECHSRPPRIILCRKHHPGGGHRGGGGRGGGGDGGGVSGSGGLGGVLQTDPAAMSRLITAQQKLAEAERILAGLEARQQAIEAQMDKIKAAADTFHIALQTEPEPTNAVAGGPAVSGPVTTVAKTAPISIVPVPSQTSPDYEEEATEAGKDWFHKYWLYGVIGLVVVLWLMTKLTRR